MSGPQPESPRFILLAQSQTYYPEEAFQAAFNEAFLGLLATAIPDGSTPRKAARAVSGMRRKDRYQAVLRRALERLRETEGVQANAVAQSGGSVVAAFPV